MRVAPDKLLHLMVGLMMAFFLSLFNIIGLFIGWAIIVGWEIWQGVSGTGTPDIADILWGGVPFTILWFVIYLTKKKYKP